MKKLEGEVLRACCKNGETVTASKPEHFQLPGYTAGWLKCHAEWCGLVDNLLTGKLTRKDMERYVRRSKLDAQESNAAAKARPMNGGKKTVERTVR